MSQPKSGLPPAPALEEYKHLSEKQRMLAGYPYKPADAELNEDRLRARELMYDYNTSRPREEAKRQEIIKDLFHPESRDKKFYIEPPFYVDYGFNIKCGNNLQVNYSCVILDCAPVTFGDNVLIAASVHFNAATHPVDATHRQDNDDYYELAKPIVIGNNVWIGGHASILPGVTIGDNCVVGSGSVVTKDFPANVVIAGNPARVIRHMPEPRDTRPVNAAALEAEISKITEQQN